MNTTGMGQELVGRIKRNRKKVAAYWFLKNAGEVPQQFFLRGTKTSRFYKVNYRAQGPTKGNVTASVVTASATTGTLMPSGIAQKVKVTVKTKRSLHRASGKRFNRARRITLDAFYNPVEHSGDWRYVDQLDRVQIKLKR